MKPLTVSLFFVIQGLSRFSDGSSITWYEPPPIQNLLDTLSDPVGHLANSTQLLEGSINASLSWNFSLSSDLSFSSLTVSLGGTVIAGVALSGPGVQAGFKDKFDIRWIPFQRVTLIIFNVTTEVNGTFSCTVAAAKGFGTVNFGSNIQVHVVDPPSNIVTSRNITITAPDELTLNCSADGKPKPTRTWTRLSDNTVVTMPLNITGKQDAGGYRCTVDNGVGSPLTKDVFIAVLVRPKIDYLSSDWDVCENSTVILSCNATGEPTPNITWKRVADDEILPAVDGVYVIDSIKRNSSGRYSCKADNGVGIDSKTVNVTVRFAASIDGIINSSNTVNEGRFFNMTCQASDNPLPTNYTWISKDGLLFNGSVLSFINISRAEAGQYRCEVENQCGMDGRNTYVNVYYPPNITYISLNQTVVDEGDVVLLNCTADGNPEPNITWNRLAGNGAVGHVGPAETYLKIAGKQDEGGYTCIADNGIGNAAFSGVLNITVESYRPINTVFSTNLTNNTVNLNESFILICNADANPAATFRLYREQEILQEHSNGTYLTFVSTRTKQVTYTCIPFNDFGDGLSKTINVTVYYAAEDTGGGGNDSVPEGNTKLFSCPVDGNPEPNITWYKGNYVIGPEISHAKQLEARETGCYTCSGSNSLGTPVIITQCLTVVPEEPTSASPTSTGQPPKQFYAALTIMEDFVSEYRDLNNQVSKQLVDSFVSEMDKIYQNDDNYLRTEVTGLRSGSVIVSFILYFKNAVTLCQGISKLEAAISNGTFGTHQVGNLTLLSPGTSTSVKSTTPRTSQPTEFQCACDNTLLVIIGVLVAIIIVLILVIAWQHRKLGIAGKKRPYKVTEDKDRRMYDNEVAMDELNPTNDPPSSSNQQRRIPIEPAYMPLQGTSHYEVGPSSPNNSPQNPEYAPLDIRTRSWEVTREDVKVEKIIGKGAFGQVAKGTAKNLPFHSGTKTVAVKMLKANAPASDKRDLKSELELMKTLKPHPHVIKLLGCVTETDPLLVLIEYVPYGDLLGYLRKSRGLNDTYYKDPDIKPQTNLTSQQLMKFAWQISDGMSYLSLRKIIHRDLAARNVLVGETETCKVTDFGMARDVQQENIYERKTRGRLPVKWTAYESLLYGKYTTKSDVWSYGVLLYEIFTVGGSPYPRMDGKKIASLLQQGYRMPKPQHVDNDLYQIMMNCWQNEPEARPSFADLTQELKGMENQHKRLLNMHIYDNTLYAKLEDLNA
ncbi:fibroblast growth factor receptor 4-like isoform X4 [Montipora foliosa]|uniref:fibroblast growth factor receptor 4-like isoform X4 n=1 Tax=Montipora foliosa TaxID=591990 RepID=UPI0035F1681B